MSAPKKQPTKVKETSKMKEEFLPMICPCMFIYSIMYKETDKSDPIPTFKGIPILKDSPYAEISWYPNTKELVILMKETYETFQFYPKLNSAGQLMINKDQKTQQFTSFQQERLLITTNFQHILHDPIEINEFLSTVAINKYDWNYVINK